MIKRFTIYICGLIGCAFMIGCNPEGDPDVEFTYGSTMVKSFKLAPDDSLLRHIDSVFFSIDLVEGRIFNADSLPYGTKTNRLCVNIKTDNCSEITFHEPYKTEGRDSVINYITNAFDSIDFSKGPVRLHLVSFDGKAERDYMVQVNVHKMVPDSLYWDKLSRRDIPTRFATAARQKTVQSASAIYCLTTDGYGSYCMAASADPAAWQWQKSSVTFPFAPDLESFAATDEALFLLATDSTLWTSVDGGATWQSTGTKMAGIFGAYGNRLLGSAEGTDGQLHHATFENGALSLSPSAMGDCPVSGTSQLVSFDTKWSAAPQVAMLGGRNADGSLSNAVWGYDGNVWAKISESFPVKIERPTLVSYLITTTDSVTWKQTQTPALLAIGGLAENGVTRDVYISRDFGVNWRKGGENLQLPNYIYGFFGAQAFVVDHNFSVAPTANRTKAIKPVTEWTAPYIYMFGGRDKTTSLFRNVWIGVINSLTFKPLI